MRVAFAYFVAALVAAPVAPVWAQNLTPPPPPLPVVFPPVSENATVNGQRTTNLFAIYFDGNPERMQERVQQSFARIDRDSDGVVTVVEMAALVNQSGLPPSMQANVAQLESQLSLMDKDGDRNVTLQEFAGVMDAVLTTNFTLFPSICWEVQQRLALCQLDPKQNISDPNLPPAADGSPVQVPLGKIAQREQTKCTSGASGLQGDYAFQRCVLGNTCGDVVAQCFEKTLDAADLAFTAASNQFLDGQIEGVSGLPTDDPTFNAYLRSGNDNTPGTTTLQVLGTTVEGGVFAALVALLGKLLMAAIMQALPAIGPQIVAALTALITGLGPQFWLVLGGITLGVVLIGAVVLQFKNLIDIVRGWWPRNDYHRLMMDSFNPYEPDSIAPRCNWATYFEQGSSSRTSLAENFWSVCDKGGTVFIDRECSSDQWKFFYQQYVPLRRCRHLCYQTNFECGQDSYVYRNLTEFLWQPSQEINQLMFTPSFSGKNYGVVDERYVYQMSQCRDACNQLTFRSGGYSKCVGFVLRGPDPMLDPRPAFQYRQVCSLLGVKEYDSDRAPDTKFPILVQSPNDIFGYDVVKNNQYPPMVTAFQQSFLDSF